MANILLVDDEPNILKLTKFYLSSLGYHVLTAANGQQALIQLKKTPQIDLIVSDYLMPELDGLELAQKVGDKYPIIIASATCDELKKQQPKNNNVVGYISKPFTLEELKKLLNKFLNR